MCLTTHGCWTRDDGIPFTACTLKGKLSQRHWRVGCVLKALCSVDKVIGAMIGAHVEYCVIFHFDWRVPLCAVSPECKIKRVIFRSEKIFHGYLRKENIIAHEYKNARRKEHGKKRTGL